MAALKPRIKRFLNKTTGGATTADYNLDEASLKVYSEDIEKMATVFTDIFGDVLISGGTTSGTALSNTVSACLVYAKTFRTEQDAATAKIFTASKDTYVHLNLLTGAYIFNEVANGAGAPSAGSTDISILKVVTDATVITSSTATLFKRFAIASGSLSVGTSSTAKFRVDPLPLGGSYSSSAGAVFSDTNLGVSIGGDTPNTRGFIQGINAGVGPGNITINPFGGNVGIGIIPTVKLHVSGSCTVETPSVNFSLNATTGNPFFDIRRGGVRSAVITSLSSNNLQILDTGLITRVHWDLSTGTLTVGNIPDARLTTNVPLKNTDNSFTGNLTLVKATPTLKIDATTGTGALEFFLNGVRSASIANAAAESGTIRYLGPTQATRVQWDLSTNPGTLLTGSIPDARLTTNVALKNINNNFTISQSFAAVGVQLTVNATTGNPEFIFQRASVNTARITSLGASLISFKDASAVEKITFNMATGVLDTVGQVKIQGGVPGLNKVLTSDAAGLATWEVNPAAPFLNNGNASGANRTLGNTDNFSLGFETNNINRLNIAANGDIDTIGNITQNLTIAKLNAAFVANATTGTPRFVANRAGVQSLAIASPSTNLLNFEDNTGSAKVTWDLTPASGGKLTQGDVPLARILVRKDIGRDTTLNAFSVGIGTTVVGDIIEISIALSLRKDSSAGKITQTMSSTSGGIRFANITSNISLSGYSTASVDMDQYHTIIGEVITSVVNASITLDIPSGGFGTPNSRDITVRTYRGT